MPFLRGLFEAIQRFQQLAYLVLLTFYYKSIRLIHLDFLIQLSIKESCLNICRRINSSRRDPERPIFRYSARGDDPEYVRLRNK